MHNQRIGLESIETIGESVHSRRMESRTDHLWHSWSNMSAHRTRIRNGTPQCVDLYAAVLVTVGSSDLAGPWATKMFHDAREPWGDCEDLSIYTKITQRPGLGDVVQTICLGGLATAQRG